MSADLNRRHFINTTLLASAAISVPGGAFARAGSQALFGSAFGGLEGLGPLTPDRIDGVARDLLAKLTVDEKLAIMSGDLSFYPGVVRVATGYNRPPPITAGAIARLDIPGIRFTDGPRGVMFPGATTFPASIARGATWDSGIEERIGAAMGREARAYGANLIGAPCINLLRHPAWGRAQETYGEDSYLLGEMGAGLTRGIQRHVMSCVKHFALNSMENARFVVNVKADARTMHEVYLPHFKRVIVGEKVASVMSAYNSVNGEWAGQSKPLLTDILRTQWGFDGFVQTDWVFGMRDAKKGALAGQDLEMPVKNLYGRTLPGLVKDGSVPVSVVDKAAYAILRQQVRFAQGRDAANYTPDVIGSDDHRALSREVAQKSIVLLKNADNVLPLRDDVRRVAIIGALADTVNLGDHGSSNTQPLHAVTPLQGLRAAAGETFTVHQDDGSDATRAAALAKFADVAIVIVGYTYRDEGEYFIPAAKGPWMDHFPPPTAQDAPYLAKLAEFTAASSTEPYGGDRKSLRLHPDDEKLIDRVAMANPKTIVVMMSGSAVITEAWRDKVAGMLMLWYPGQEGGHALADILTGKANPSGRLPCSFVKRTEDLPFFDPAAKSITYDLWHGYRKLDRDKAEPAFPFGFGLSYTTFALRNLALETARIDSRGTVSATVDLQNTGAMAGEDVVQCYVAALSSKVPRAVKELKAFAKVALTPGETKPVRLSVPASALAYYDEARGWIVEPGDYEMIVARNANDPAALRQRFRIG